MRKRETPEDTNESVSGAMSGRGEGAGSADLPYPKTDPADTGRGDGGLDASRRSAERDASRDDAHRDEAIADDARTGTDRDDRGADREHGGWGDRGIGGGRAGGTGP